MSPTRIPFALVLVPAVVALAACGRHEAPIPPSGAPAASLEAVPYVVEGEVSPGGNCALDAVNGATPVAGAATISGDVVTFAGWVGNAAGAVPDSARLLLSGPDATFAMPLSAGGARPDVAAALGSPGLELSGFNLSGTLSGVPAGSYVASILMGDAPQIRCELNVTVQRDR